MTAHLSDHVIHFLKTLLSQREFQKLCLTINLEFPLEIRTIVTSTRSNQKKETVKCRYLLSKNKFRERIFVNLFLMSLTNSQILNSINRRGMETSYMASLLYSSLLPNENEAQNEEKIVINRRL